MNRAAGKMSSSSEAAMARFTIFIRTLYRKVSPVRKGSPDRYASGSRVARIAYSRWGRCSVREPFNLRWTQPWPDPDHAGRRSRLLADAKRREDAIEDVVGGSGSCDGVDGPERAVEIEQQHFVRDVFRHRAACFGEILE